MAEYTCGHCWRTMGDHEGGYGSYDRVPLCHPNVEGRPDCYTNVSRNGHPVLNCRKCKEGWNPDPEFEQKLGQFMEENKELLQRLADGPEDIYEALGAQGFSEEDVDDLLTSFEQMARGEGRVLSRKEIEEGKYEDRTNPGHGHTH